MIVTDDEELAEKCRMYRNLCFQKDVRYVHNEIGDNYRFTNLQAAVGLAQLERLDEFVAKKREIGAYYTSHLRELEGLILPVEETDSAKNIYWVYAIVLGENIKLSNREMTKRLGERGIGTRTFFWCMKEQTVYQKMGLFQGEHYKNAEYLARKGFYIPSGLALTREQMDVVVEELTAIVKGQ